MTDKRESYVYVVFRLDGEPCYVGKGKRGRWKQHITKSHNSHLQRIFAKAGGDLPIVKVREGLTDADACETEIALIAAIGRVKNGGPLVNFTDGGEGSSGLVQSKETVAKRVAKLRGKKHSPESYARAGRAVSVALKGRSGAKWSEERKLLASARLAGVRPSDKCLDASADKRRGVPLSAAHKEKLGAISAAIPRSPEWGAAISAGKRGRKLSDTARRNISLAHMGHKQTPQTVQRRSAALRGRPWSDARRAAEVARRQKLEAASGAASQTELAF